MNPLDMIVITRYQCDPVDRYSHRFYSVCSFFLFFYTRGNPNVYPYSTLPVLYLYYIYTIVRWWCIDLVRSQVGVLAVCVPHLSRQWSRSPTLHPLRSTLYLSCRSMPYALHRSRHGLGRQPDHVLPSARSRGPMRWDMTPVCACTQLFSPHRNFHVRGFK